MSKFQTIVEIPKYDWQLDYQSLSMFMGSCFAENIGSKLIDSKFNIDLNPFGILYNPVSVENSLRMLLQNKKVEEHELINRDGLWHSFFHHSRFSHENKTETLRKINSKIRAASKFLRTANSLFITFGTAWVYEHKETQQVVSNCHKIPNSEFTRYRIGVDEIVARFNHLLKELFQVNPSLKVVFTVSPIRHWKDGAIQNQVSKATLLLAIDSIVKKAGNEACSYFPSYEIVMDELRDYRFYAEDKLHISEVATNHIWEKFEQAFMEPGTLSLKMEIEKIVRAKNHRPFNPKTEKHQKFLSNCLMKCEELEGKYAYINLKLEKEYFAKQLKLI